MKYRIFFLPLLCLCLFIQLDAQSIKGNVSDETTGEPLIGASIIIEGTTSGTITDFEGNFELNVTQELPVNLIISYVGYDNMTRTINSFESVDVEMSSAALTIDVIEVEGQRISEKQQQAALTVESLDNVAIKQAASADFYESLGNLKGVDLTTASLGFKIVNTRGFNSTSPVRSLQLIDGVDNQSPGLNFSLGNFLGVSDLDINKVELIVGASSAFYGPNAFNGVISMHTKDPFYSKGLSAEVKAGERNLFTTALRWADAVKNKDGFEWLGYKLNLYRMSADDWEAENYNPVDDSEEGLDNPGGFDAVNIYGDEFNRQASVVGIGRYYRKGYREIDLVDYSSENNKAAASVHFRLKPEMDYESPELVLGSSFGGGTTVYQGDNRYSLRNIRFFQHKIELRKKDQYFIRSYMTHENAGDSYDPFFTALKLQEYSKDNTEWNTSYLNYWSLNVVPRLQNDEDFPRRSDYPGDIEGYNAAIDLFLLDKQDSLFIWHGQAQDVANTGNPAFQTLDFLEPGTAEFQHVFDSITSAIANSEGGTRFFDESALYHLHGEYKFNDVYKGEGTTLTDLDFTLGVAGRLYRPDSRGSILLDTMGRNIDTYEYGVYGGSALSFLDDKFLVNASLRMDKHENFDYLFSPAASVVYQPSAKNYIRLSFSSAIRNPTLSDQYLNYNVGPAILLGNLNGFENLVTVESFVDFLDSQDREALDTFNVSPIQPEKVRSLELGYRTSLFNSVFIDMSGYLSRYEDFIGFELGVVSFIPPPPNAPLPTNTQVYRVSSNARDIVNTRGISIGLNYFFQKYYQLQGNYSYNELTTKTDDPIIPAFNTPKNKYNIGISGRDIPRILGMRVPSFGFNVNYKWIEGFIFEGSPQFTGFIPAYDLLDGQINFKIRPLNTVLKIGASNILDNKVFQTYGGPRIGRLAYVSLSYNFEKK